MPVERRQKLRGTTAQLNATPGLLGLLTVDISTMGLRVFDGVTVGGYAIPNKNTNDAAYVPQSRLVQGSEGISAGGDLGSNVMLELAGQARTLHDWQDTGILFHTGSEGEYRPILLTTGLEINDVDIGGTMTLVMTPDATVVRTSGEQTIAGGLTAFEDDLYVTGAAGTLRALRFSTGNNDRFSIGINSAAEGGANAGSNLQMHAYDDAGAVLGSVLSINRATRVVSFDQPITGSGLGLTGLVPATRQVATGDGLTGGGDLSADRTLALDATVVRTTGNQSISGIKTHSSLICLANDVALSGYYANGVTVRNMVEMSSDNVITFGAGDTDAALVGKQVYFGIGSTLPMLLTSSGSLRNYRADGWNFLGESGSASSPTFSFNGAQGRGMYATTDGVGISVGNSLRAEITASGISGAGSGLTGLNASQLASGTVPAARLNFADLAEAQAATSTTAVMNPLRTLTTINAYSVGRAQTINSPSRSVGVSYENTTNSPIVVLITIGLTTQVQMSANGSTWVDMGLATGSDSSRRNTITMIVPPGYFYRVESGGTVHLWRELR